MPSSAVILLAGALCVIIALASLAFWLRARARRRLEARLRARHADQVSYAFIINPSKPQADHIRSLIKEQCTANGLQGARFYDTQLDKDGKACARQALKEGADVVVAVGGDGTVRTVASAVAGSGHTLGIIPIGTGNLFARNLGIPVGDPEAALAVATSHGSRLVDVGRMRILDSPDPDARHAFLIIAGIGFDALMIDDTDPNLKRNLSWLAYFISGAKHLFADKYRGDMTIRQQDGRSQTNMNVEFRTFMAGNCGEIPGFSLMPDASFDDGILDFELIDTSGGLIGWANLFGDVMHQTITRKASQSPLSTNSSIVQVQGASAEIRLRKPALAQVDGDILGETRHIELTVDHQALCVRVPVA
ncbi:diacylglycerol/lipid kinase family protein [Bifidobacterium xylocopae]|uniref:Diacylglycerol kinase n=1 Tax=Bifidobacterium xylocopae TaxID=2493119 RepID=A0A366KDH0_9BIFI|nr:diacylglycerol kinase family protein [Bifidobacterium xylocopae]RBP99760.1 diacylglycerol kinase [Bifidobacterium xylocopae]